MSLFDQNLTVGAKMLLLIKFTLYHNQLFFQDVLAHFSCVILLLFTNISNFALKIMHYVEKNNGFSGISSVLF